MHCLPFVCNRGKDHSWLPNMRWPGVCDQYKCISDEKCESHVGIPGLARMSLLEMVKEWDKCSSNHKLFAPFALSPAQIGRAFHL